MNRPLATRTPERHCCPIEWAQEIDLALALLGDFVADIETGHRPESADSAAEATWALAVLWYAAGHADGAGMAPVARALAEGGAPGRRRAADLITPLVGALTARIEQRIASAASMLARFC
jgi:hypothetical protein